PSTGTSLSSKAKASKRFTPEGLLGLMIRGCGHSGIDLDPVAPHLRSFSRALPIEDNHVGLLLRHMAVDAVRRDGMIGAGEGRRIGLMKVQAPLREPRKIVLRGMNVMARDTGHIRRAEAAALLQQLNLVAMHIQGRVGIGWRKIDVLC